MDARLSEKLGAPLSCNVLACTTPPGGWCSGFIAKDSCECNHFSKVEAYNGNKVATCTPC
jgi:hypothetical protein